MVENGIYTGILFARKMSKEARRGYYSYKRQKDRCKNAKTYKGIRVEYGVREFIAWWLKEIKKRKKWHRPVTARIDHAKNYSFDNIILQECSENSIERINRLGSPSYARKKKVRAIDGTGKLIKGFDSVTDAARHFDLCFHTILNHCNGKTKRPFKNGKRSGTGFFVRFEWSK